MTRKLFGTDGVRGMANQWPMTPEIALQLGQAAAIVFREKHGAGIRGRIILGKGTRLSGYMLEQALAAGISSMGADVYLVGPLPTPGIAFLTSSMRADAGIVISGSHNSYEDNGIKFFSRDGFKLPDEIEHKIENLILDNKLEANRPRGRQVGKAYRIDDSIGRYVVFLKNTFPKDLTLEGIKIVLDCAHGAAYKVGPAVLSELGAQVVKIGVDPNGENINYKCGSLHTDLLREKVLEAKAHLGIALDGDADRVIFCDERGQIIDGDKILCTLALELKTQDKLPQNTVVATTMSNMGLEDALKRAGISLIRTAVGDRYVVDEMRKRGCNLGGEQSGHLIFMDHNTTGDGMIAALQVLSLMQQKQKSLSELTDTMNVFPQEQINLKVREKPDLMSIAPVAEAIHEARTRLKDSGRVFVRYSGTEAVARVLVEGPDHKLVQTLALAIADSIRDEIGV